MAFLHHALLRAGLHFRHEHLRLGCALLVHIRRHSQVEVRGRALYLHGVDGERVSSASMVLPQLPAS